MIIYMLFADICLAAILVTNFSGHMSTYPAMLTVFALLGRFGALSAWSTLICMTLESFPTTLRSRCLGFVSFAGYLGGIVAPQSLVLGSVSPSLPYILYCILMITSSIFAMFLYEMAGEPLKDTVT
ncbi:unnamed protein product [Allacma fusca]|uniref:Major facilitator superfamily (MFS) profile domain-containing protein n=1 Tax=Allacma fusca TaxID=39272 RepID=A0A8J2PMD5_9HEXA|nr:unnamed protein product [Allacma fusca]